MPIERDFNKASTMEFTLRPSRSMTSVGKKVFYGALAAKGAVALAFTAASGAWPVGVIVCTVLGGTAFAMKQSDRSGKEYQRLHVANGKLALSHFRPGMRQEQYAQTDTYFLQVIPVMAKAGHCEKLLVGERGDLREIGSFLPPEEKEEFAKTLKEAVRISNMPDHMQQQAINDFKL